MTPLSLLRFALPLCIGFNFAYTTLALATTSADLAAEAIAKNPEIQYYEAQIAVARGDRQKAGEYANPELGVEFGHKKIVEISGEVEGEGRVWRAQMMQVFDFPGRMGLRKALADHDIALAELGLAQFKSQLTNQVKALAGEILLLRQKENATQSVMDRLQALVEVLVQRDTGNISAKLERRILEASLVTSDRTRTDAAKEVAEATVELNLLCGRSAEAKLELEDSLPAFPQSPDLNGLMQLAAIGNFDLQQKRMGLARQGIKVDLTKSERWGNISFGGYLAGERHYEKDFEGGVAVSIPLPLWNKNKGNIAAEKAREAQAEAQMLATLRDLEGGLAKALSGYNAELGSLGRWRVESEKEFQAAAVEADKHYRLGAVPAPTYVEMQRGYLEALDALIQTRRNAWLHLMQLERLTGGSLSKKP